VATPRLAVGKDAAGVSHETALDLLDLSDVIPDTVHLTVPRTRRGLEGCHRVLGVGVVIGSRKDTVGVHANPAVLAEVVRAELPQSIDDERVRARGRNDCDVHEREDTAGAAVCGRMWPAPRSTAGGAADVRLVTFADSCPVAQSKRRRYRPPENLLDN
jgi:hypothetical protein